MAGTYYDGNDAHGWSETGGPDETGVTITGWYRPTTVSPGFKTIFSFWGPGYEFIIELNIDGGDGSYGIWADDIGVGVVVDSGYIPSVDEWFFFAVTRVGGTIRLMISTGFTSFDYDVTDTGNAATWELSDGLVGNNSINDYADGHIHHLRVFSSVLSDAAILAEMGSTSAVSSAWAAWELEDASTADASGNGRTLSVANGSPNAGTESAPVPSSAPVDNALFFGCNF